MKKFCPKCGKPVKLGAAFCPNCGAKLASAQNNDHVNKVAQNPAPATNQEKPARQQYRKPQRPPMSKKKKIIISCVAAAAVIIIGFTAWGRHYYDAAHQVTRITNAIRDDDTAKLASLVKTDNKSVKVTADSVKPLAKYYDGQDARLNVLKNTLISGGSIRGISLVQDGHYLLFFPKYKLNVESYSPSVKTNHKDSKIYVDGKYVTTASDDGTGSYVAKLGPYLGGKYNVQVKAAVSGHDISTDSYLSVWSDRQHNYDIETANIAIYGPNDGQVYIGNKKVGKISNGSLVLKDFQYTDESSAYIVYSIGGKKFTSKEASISQAVYEDQSSDSYSDDDDDFADARKNASKIKSSYVTVYPEFKAAPNLEDLNHLVTDCFKDPSENEFINGSSNKYYKSFDKMANIFDESDKISSWNVEPEITSVYPIGDGVFECDANIYYIFEHDDDSHIQVAHYPHITFRSDNGTFKILSVGDGKIVYDNNNN